MSNPNINEDAQSGGEYSGSQSSVNDGPSQPIESAFPDEDEDTITMLDVIEQEDKLEEEASAVLGNSDEKNCTYPKGYIPRQALYSCATCSTDPDNLAAVCLACSLECHDNHEVYELYTKRNYRCDCGNSKFKPGFECKFVDRQQKKCALNEENKYNHNFVGRYCICDKRYPPDEHDDSPESNDEMWQCIVCEDWYHSRHLGASELPTKFDEMICGQCVETLEFVHYYKHLDKIEDSKSSGSPNETTDQTLDEKKSYATSCKVSDISETNKAGASISDRSASILNRPEKGGNVTSESDTNDSQAENKDPKASAQSDEAIHQTKVKCVLRELMADFNTRAPQCSNSLKSHTTDSSKAPLFWSNCNWRSKLCRCESCMDMYKAKKCEYLLDEKDTVQYYEAQGKAIAKTNGSPFERGMTALNRMDRAAVVEALHGYDELKANLSDYLRKFADTKKIVREEDIHEFFQQLKSKKRQKLEFP